MKMNTQLLYIALALIAGAFVPFQTASNTAMSRSFHSGIYASLVVFVVAAIAMIILIIVRQEPFPSSEQVKEVPLFAWVTGGLLGAAYIFLLIFLAPKLGMASVTGFVVAGQLLMAVAFDHFGLMGFAVHSINWQRIGGIVLLIIGLFLIKKY
jgi:transporter family-2 protein